MNRRGFFALLAGAAVAPLAVLAAPKRYGLQLGEHRRHFCYQNFMPEPAEAYAPFVAPAGLNFGKFRHAILYDKSGIIAEWSV